jgi:hypothetical protein
MYATVLHYIQDDKEALLTKFRDKLASIEGIDAEPKKVTRHHKSDCLLSH